MMVAPVRNLNQINEHRDARDCWCVHNAAVPAPSYLCTVDFMIMVRPHSSLGYQSPISEAQQTKAWSMELRAS